MHAVDSRVPHPPAGLTPEPRVFIAVRFAGLSCHPEFGRLRQEVGPEFDARLEFTY